MSNPRAPQTKPEPPATTDAEDIDHPVDQPASKNYYYDDSTGYEIYEHQDEEDDLDSEQ